MRYLLLTACLLALLAGPALGDEHADADAAPGPLADTRWELVKIQSMDDTTHTPLAPAKYTLAFGADGSVAIGSDCNRATGTWESDGSRLVFNGLAGTRALCRPGSLDETYRSQFAWVRSYVMKDGHLFLATMADGAIIEFQPAPDAP